MIIECKNCNKKFNVNDKLIPLDGRQIKCGSCNHSWHFIIEKPLEETNIVKEETTIIKNEDLRLDQTENKKNFELPTKIKINKIEDKNQRSNNFFSYLLVSIISFIALIIVVDTLKTPLIGIFPGLEIILFNLFETLKDVKLFIIDLI